MARLKVCSACQKRTPDEGFKICNPCRERSIKKYYTLAEKGLCTAGCGEQAVEGKRTCRKHLKKQREKFRKRIANGLCSSGCGRKPKRGKRCCEPCLDRSRSVAYGVSPDTIRAMRKQQKNKCAICDEKPKGKRGLSVDHDHDTGQVRKLLCTNCNAGLGHYRDRVDLLQAAIRYLEDHGK